MFTIDKGFRISLSIDGGMTFRVRCLFTVSNSKRTVRFINSPPLLNISHPSGSCSQSQAWCICSYVLKKTKFVISIGLLIIFTQSQARFDKISEVCNPESSFDTEGNFSFSV